ncbi:GNAT family N-acetyltransferase [Mesobacterium pallidum]|uniref:GNAT family N-acetyltransferase n=1 Tax=Mesobacterium pallidum TaxID=2872037 RepID=UPI001EE37F5F|nr:GNAT family N-acetyltransferase [Mesobacterium pallidum]
MFDSTPLRRPVPLPQSAGFRRAARLLGLPLEEITLTAEGQPLALALMQTRRLPLIGRVGLISRGPLWAGAPDAGHLAAALRALRHPVLLNAETDPPGQLAQAGFLPIMTPATLARLDLRGSATDRRARMQQKWRNRLYRAEETPLKIRRSVLPPDPNHWLLAAERQQRRTRRYTGLPPEFCAAWSEANPHMAQLFTAELHGQPVAAMLFLRHGQSATYQVGHTTEAGRALHAHSLLLSRAADWLADHGTDWLDLGTLDTVNAPGLARFKLGAGASPYRLGGTWLWSRQTAPLARRLPAPSRADPPSLCQ